MYELLSGRKTKTLERILQTSQQEEEDRRQKEIGPDNKGSVGWMECRLEGRVNWMYWVAGRAVEGQEVAEWSKLAVKREIRVREKIGLSIEGENVLKEDRYVKVRYRPGKDNFKAKSWGWRKKAQGVIATLNDTNLDDVLRDNLCLIGLFVCTQRNQIPAVVWWHKMHVDAIVRFEESSQCSQTTTTDSSVVNLWVCREQAMPIQSVRVCNLHAVYADLEAEALQNTKHSKVLSNIIGTIKSVFYRIFVSNPKGDV